MTELYFGILFFWNLVWGSWLQVRTAIDVNSIEGRIFMSAVLTSHTIENTLLNKPPFTNAEVVLKYFKRSFEGE